MTASSRRAFILLALLTGSVVVGSALLAIEAHLAPLPGPDNPKTFDETVDSLEASTVRWLWFYLPAFGLGIAVGVGRLIRGSHAWLDFVVASLFFMGLVFVHHVTVSFKSAWIFVPVYLFVGMLVATLIRGKTSGLGE